MIATPSEMMISSKNFMHGCEYVDGTNKRLLEECPRLSEPMDTTSIGITQCT